MFPRRQRPPRYLSSPRRYQRAQIQRGPGPTNPSFLNLFQDNDGKFDVNRIFSSIQHMEKTYKQVSPYITRFMKR
jgi:hypothetical protein